MALRGELVEDAAALEPLIPAWDDLAIALRLPYCAPAWQLAWWHHVAPEGAQLRVIAAWDGERLAGLAPFYAEPGPLGTWRYALLSAPQNARVEPLAAAADRREAAAAFASVLAGANPHPSRIALSQMPADSPWPGWLRELWPDGRPLLHCEVTVPAPTVSLTAENLDAWLASRSPNFRSQIRRSKRKLKDLGGTSRVTTLDELDHDLAEFARLHHARWNWRGGSDGMPPGMDRMLADASRAMVPDGRLRIVSIHIDGRAITTVLLVAAGGEASFWNGGFDESFSSYRPGIVGLIEAISMAIAVGDQRLDLGPGAAYYKLRLADGGDELSTWVLVPPGRGALRARAIVAARRAKRSAGTRFTDEQKLQIKRLLGRGR